MKNCVRVVGFGFEFTNKLFLFLSSGKKFAPFFMEWKIDYIITLIKNSEPVTCGHCKHLTVQDDGVNYCRLYKTAKPWDGFCEKGEKR